MHVRLESAKDSRYGLSEHVPVKIGPRHDDLPHIYYLNSLRGPNGEPVDYERIGTCCDFKIPGSPLGFGLLDVYRLRIDGPYRGIYLFIDMYNQAPLKIPVGFTQRQ